MSTIKQRWAQERNFNLRRLKGVETTLRSIAKDMSTVGDEYVDLLNTYKVIANITKNWSEHSRLSRNQYIQHVKGDSK